MHVPVMLEEVEQWFHPIPAGGVLLDATVGAGGHSVRLLELCEKCRLVGVDADRSMIDRAKKELDRFGERAQVVNMWFDEFLTSDDRSYDRILFDLGVSTFHFRDPEVGMSLRESGPLDMRLDRNNDESPTAAKLLATLPESDLADLIYQYGEERYSRRIARAIVTERNSRRVEKTDELAEIVRRAVPPAARRGRFHPATRTFQALRIAVNRELDRLARALPAAMARLKPGGRLAVISFHSLEDRIVKHQFRDVGKGAVRPSKTGQLEPMVDTEASSFRVLTKKPVIPSESEVAANTPSRSAKLRVIERLRQGGAA